MPFVFKKKYAKIILNLEHKINIEILKIMLANE